MSLFAVVCGIILLLIDDINFVRGDRGLALLSANEWISNCYGSFCANIVLTLITTILMVLLNKHYNLIRSMTVLYVGLFMFMLMATPDILGQLGPGTILCLCVIVCAMILYSCYTDKMSTRSVFTIFLILSTAATTQYCFLVYVPVFLIGCAQMRIFNLRTFVAAMLGIITPWWIFFGFGIIKPEQLHLPHIVSIIEAIDLSEILQLLLTVGFTALLAILAMVLNVFKTIAYNARTRAYFGLLNLVTVITILAMAADYSNMTSYVPLMNCCAAYQVTHFFAIHAGEKSYIGLISIIATYLGFYIWRIAI
jgi:hypothetical protein